MNAKNLWVVGLSLNALQQPVDSADIVALFDFDGTLTHCDSLMPFLRFAVGRTEFWIGLALLTPDFMSYILGRLDRAGLKNAVLRRYIGGWPAIRLRDAAERFIDIALPSLCNGEALARIDWHHEQGHRIILVSASPEIYLTPWAATLPIEAVLATRLEFQAETVSGQIDRNNCRGAEKVERVIDYLGGLEGYKFFAYGDSAGDREMLAIATHGFYRPFRRPNSGLMSGLRFVKALL